MDYTVIQNAANKIVDNFKSVGNDISGLKERATDLEQEVAVLDSRMDVFTALPEGATTNDAALEDIKVGYDGTVYEGGPGDAVRAQVSQLSSEIEDLGEIVGVAHIRDSLNMIKSASANNVAFSDIFTSSQKVYFEVGIVTTETGQLSGIIQFTDETYATSGVWYLEDKNGNTLLSGGINQAKQVDDTILSSLYRVGFYFGGSARSEYSSKTIKNVGLHGGVHTTSSNWILDDYAEHKTSSILNNYEQRITDLEEMKITCNWYVEDNYYIAQGLELNIYYDTICDTSKDVYFVVDTTADKSYCDTMDNCLRFKTNSNIGEYECKISAYDKGNDTLIGQSSFTVNVVADTKPTKKIMFIGDSLIDQNYFVEQVKDNSAGNIALYGTRGNDGYKHEGRSGWYPSTYRYQQSYNDIENAFYNANKNGDDKFDFAYYMQNKPQFADVEVVNIMLGRNGGYDNDNLVNHINALVENIKEYNSNITVFVCLPYFTPWFGDNYYSDRKYSAYKMNEASFVGYKSMKEGIVNATLVPIGVNIDTVYDFPHSTENVSARNTSDVKTYYTDCVHPSIYGYQKMADVWYSYMLGII